MAEIAPFRGLRYNREKITDLAQVVIPPYDVISLEEQKKFHERNPYNYIRLELGLSTPEDSPANNPHTRAAAFMKQWERDGILLRNPEPSIYRCELDYSTGNELKTRKGFICLMRLEDFSSGRVRPHEKTFKAIKQERLALMMACNANLSPVFALYADTGGKVQNTLESNDRRDPASSFTDSFGMAHRIWPVSDRGVLSEVRKLILDKPIFIADGHHRYETALNYRTALRERHGATNPNAPFEFIMVYLSDMNESGLTILPTHRLLKNLGSLNYEGLIEKAEKYFDIERFTPENGGELRWKNAIQNGGELKNTSIGFYAKGAPCIYVLTAKESAVSSWLAQKGTPPQLRTLDVVVLDQIVLRELMGLSDEFLADEGNISFIHDFTEALKAVKSSGFEAGFFINHTRIEQVSEVASAGLVMPHKSTYFYPKVTSGLVINPILPNEEII